MRGADEYDYQSLRADSPTVVFVSGFGAPRRSLDVIKRRLQREGLNVVMVSVHWQNLVGIMSGLYQMARELGSVVLEIRKRSPKSPIHLVAHSAGGIVARYYIQLLGGSHYCATLTTLATPHRGTWLAVLGFFSHLIFLARALLQLCPGSGLIRQINEAQFPSDTQLVSISSKDDLICSSRTASLPASFMSKPNVVTVEVSGMSHSDFILTKKGYRLIEAVIQGWETGLANDVLAAIHANHIAS
jgi:triacylglycerol esterase/lipase EstA (alpha/beta hydrolase family)